MSRRSVRYLVFGALVACAGLFVYLTGSLDYIPRLHASATSPDGTLRVMVYRKRLAMRPIFPRMGAVARIYDQDGRLVYDKTIYSDDDWDDTVGEAYKEISFTDDEIRIGPGAYDPGSAYIIRKSELWTLPN